MPREAEFAELLTPPTVRGPVVDWVGVEDLIGFRLPSDYKWLVDAYGPGVFDEFIHVFQPAHPREAIRLDYQADRAVSNLDYLRSRGEVMPYETRDLYPFFRTDNGDTGYWLRRPPEDPDAWTVVVNEARGTRWPDFTGGAVEFLYAILSGQQRLSVFPEDFPSDNPDFRSY